MSTVDSIIPELIDALVAKARSLPAITSKADVTDGYSVSQSQRDLFSIGVDDPASESQAASASSRQDWHSTSTREEDGDIVIASFSTNGAGDMKKARDSAFAYVRAFADAIRSDYTLGGLTNGSARLVNVQFGEQVDYYSNQTSDEGAEATVVFRVKFEALI